MGKWRQNALILAGMVTSISIFLLYEAIDLAEKLILTPMRATGLDGAAAPIAVGDVALVVGIATLAITVTAATVAGILGLAQMVSSDPPPPTVPADVHERLLRGKSEAAQDE